MKKIKIKIILLIIILGTVSVWPQTILAWIEPEYLNQEVFNLFNLSSNNILWRGDFYKEQAIKKCATPLLLMARKRSWLLSEENQACLYRPTEPYDEYYYGYGVEVWSYNSQNGHFRLYYTENNKYGDAVQDSDGQSNTVPPYIIRFSQYFEQAWSYIHETLKYSVPSGANSIVEVYIMDVSAYGITSADDQGLYIMVDNTYQWVRDNLDQEGKAIGAMKVTAAHEYFHVVQAEYDHWPESNDENMWWEENTAVWLEEQLYDSVDDYLNYLGWPYNDNNENGQWNNGEAYINIWGTIQNNNIRSRGWFDYPHISLNKTSYDLSCPYDLFEYGGVIWPVFLSEHLGSTIIRLIFEQIPKSSYDTLMATDQAIRDLRLTGSSFSSAFIRYKLANLYRHYEEGQRYPLPFHQLSYSLYPQSINDDLNPLSCKYLIFQKPGSSESQSLNFSFKGNSQTDFALLAVPITSYISPSPFGQAKRISLTDEQTGVFDFSFKENPSCTKLIIIPINLSTGPDDSYYQLEAKVAQGSQLPTPVHDFHAYTLLKDSQPLVKLLWEDIQKPGQYQIWRGLLDDYQSIIFDGYIDGNSYQDKDPDLESDQTYIYQLKSVNETGTSASDFLRVKIPSWFPADPWCQKIPLHEGWNLISFQANTCYYDQSPPPDFIPVGVEMIDVAKDLGFRNLSEWLSCLLAHAWERIISFDSYGAHILDINLPEPINNLHYFSPGYGYWIKMNKAKTAEFCGLRLSPDTPVKLKAGWNLAGYLLNECYFDQNPAQNLLFPTPAPAFYQVDSPVTQSVLGPVQGKYRRVISFDQGGTHIFDTQLPQDLSTLHYMGPGFGYWIKMDHDGDW